MKKVTRKTVKDKSNTVKKSLKTSSHERRGKQPFIELWLETTLLKTFR